MHDQTELHILFLPHPSARRASAENDGAAEFAATRDSLVRRRTAPACWGGREGRGSSLPRGRVVFTKGLGPSPPGAGFGQIESDGPMLYPVVDLIRPLSCHAFWGPGAASVCKL